MGKTIRGYAAVYNSRTLIGGEFNEYIKPGAFRSVLNRKDDVLCLYNHDDNQLLGRTASGTCRLRSDDNGLAYDTDLPDSVIGEQVGALIARGDITGSSFGFIVGSDEWSMSADGSVDRCITSIDTLIDVSPVNQPAYASSTCALARSAPARIPKSGHDAETLELLAMIDAVKRDIAVSEAKDNASWSPLLAQLNTEMQRAGMVTIEKNSAIAKTAATGKRTFRLGGKIVSQSEFIKRAKQAGKTGIEKRLNAGIERINTRGGVAGE